MIDHLPRTTDDLTAWSVFADSLLEQGDPRGELIAFDLSLGAHPTRGQTSRLTEMASKLGGGVDRSAGWCLGFLRELRIDHRRVARALATVRSPIGRFIERIEIDDFAPNDLSWGALFAALPPTCTQAIFIKPTRAREAAPELPDGVEAIDALAATDGTRTIRWRTDDHATGELPLPRIPLWETQRRHGYANVAMQLANAVPGEWGLYASPNELAAHRSIVGTDTLHFDGRTWHIANGAHRRELAPGMPFVVTQQSTRFTCVLTEIRGGAAVSIETS